MFHNRISRIASIAMVTATAFAVSCSDLSTASRRSSAESDFVADGKVESQLWLPGEAGLQVASATSMDISVSNAGGTPRVIPGNVSFALTDSATAQRLGMTHLDARAAIRNVSVDKMLLKAKHVGTQTIDGKRYARYVVRDGDPRSGRPPKTVLFVVDGRLVALTDYVWRGKRGAWRLLRSHTSFINGRGTLTMAYDVDATELAYHAAATPAILSRSGQAARSALVSVARLVQPDALYAAPVEEACIKEGLKAMAAGAAVIAAGFLVEASRITFNAATEALTVALAACMTVEMTCPDLVPLIAAEAAAAAIFKQATAALTAAILLAAAADVELAECRRQWEYERKPETITGAGSDESNCATDEEEWCEWSLSWPDGVLRVEKTICWCQAGDYES